MDDGETVEGSSRCHSCQAREPQIENCGKFSVTLHQELCSVPLTLDPGGAVPRLDQQKAAEVTQCG